MHHHHHHHGHNQPQQQNQYGGYQGNQPRQQNQYQGNQQQNMNQNNMQNQQMMNQQQMMYQQQLRQQQMMNNQMMQQNNMMHGQLTSVPYGNMQQQQPMFSNYQPPQQQQQQPKPQYQQQQQPQQQQMNTNTNVNTNNTNLTKKLNTDKFDDKQRDQPLNDAQPSLRPLKTNKEYTEKDAKEDAGTLYKAFKGFGSDKKTITMIAGRRTTYQRVMIKRAYNQEYGKKEGFIKRLKSETSGKYEDMLVNLFKDAGFIDAMVIHDAMEGMGFNTDQLLEVLVTRTNQEILDMKKVYQNKFKETLEKRVGSETKKTFGSGSFKTFCLKICEAKRPLSGKDDQNAIQQDAEMLNRQLQQGKKDDTKRTFVQVFTERSWSHLAAMAGIFQQISKKYTLMSAVQHAFGKSDTCKGMQMIIDFVTQPYDFWAKRFVKSMEGMGTNDKLLQRLVITRCEIDLFSIQQVFGQRYGKGKTLKNWIEDDTSGDYEKLLLCLCGYVD